MHAVDNIIGASCLSIVLGVSAVALAASGPEPCPECFTQASCSTRGSLQACYACCIEHCPDADVFDCQDCCEQVYGSS
jgi:hypothetical protein